jgi:hypothetical protein
VSRERPETNDKCPHAEPELRQDQYCGLRRFRIGRSIDVAFRSAKAATFEERKATNGRMFVRPILIVILFPRAVFRVRTLKASHSIAQGKLSGVSRKAPPWVAVPRSSSTLKGLHKILSHPFRVLGLSDSHPRAALRLPWAMVFNRFAVRAKKTTLEGRYDDRSTRS